MRICLALALALGGGVGLVDAATDAKCDSSNQREDHDSEDTRGDAAFVRRDAFVSGFQVSKVSYTTLMESGSYILCRSPI